MRRIRVSLALLMAAMLAAASGQTGLAFDGDESPNQEMRNVSPIFIMNEKTEVWSIKVWAYPGHSTSPDIWTCETLDFFSDYSRAIEPWKVANPFLTPFLNHCGNYDSLTFEFRMLNRITGEVRDYSTFGRPAPWGARWKWDGQAWSCIGC